MKTPVLSSVVIGIATIAGCSHESNQHPTEAPVTQVSSDVEESGEIRNQDPDFVSSRFTDPTIAWRVLEVRASQWTCELHNRTSARLTHVKVAVRFYDADNQVLGEGVLSFRHVRSGERMSDTTFCVAAGAVRCDMDFISVTALTPQGETVNQAERYLQLKQAE